MGLFKEALRLSINLTNQKSGTQELDYLHLQNAINGFQIAERLEDVNWTRRFNIICEERLATAGHIGKPWEAYVSAQRASLLIAKGKPKAAIDEIARAESKEQLALGDRAYIILQCARARCVFAKRDQAAIAESKKSLWEVLKVENLLIFDKENILRTLFLLYTADRGKKDRKTGLDVSRNLNDHIINVKHREFFGSLSGTPVEDVLKKAHAQPFYALPTSIVRLTCGKHDDNKLVDHKSAVEKSEMFSGASLVFSRPAHRKIEAKWRTQEYKNLENLAIAADFPTSRSGHHCFEVGFLAGLIALESNQGEEQAVAIEMACRLHDIGKISICSAFQKAVALGEVESYSLTREHTQTGYQLLRGFDQTILKIAANVACFHHAWWNGCGQPEGLAGEQIPLEARICLLANTFVSLLQPSPNRTPWEHGSAVKQVSSLAGVQADPNLVLPFQIAAERFGQLLGYKPYADSRADPLLLRTPVLELH